MPFLLAAVLVAGCRRASVVAPEPPKPSEVVRVAGVSLELESLEMKVGDRAFLVHEITPQNADNRAVTWFSSNAAVATVDDAGEVNAVVEGVAKITVKTLDGGFEAACTVTVKAETNPDPDDDDPEKESDDDLDDDPDDDPKDPDDDPDDDPDPEDPPTSGEIGGLGWALSLDEGALTIRGSGDLPNYAAPAARGSDGSEDVVGAGAAPWDYYRDRIERLILPASIGRIGANCFAECRNLVWVECAAPKPPELGQGNFDAQYYDTLVVPGGALALYGETPAWQEAFGSIEGS